MFCTNCGAQNDEGSVFCMNCGTKMEEVPAAPKEAPKVAPKTAKPKQQAQPKPAEQPTPVPVKSQTTQYQPPAQVQAPVQEGVLSAAWHDIKSTPSWFKKILLMALFNLIPFLNFGTIGYSQKWGVEVIKGQRNTMPNQIFNNRNFIAGALEFISWTALGFVYIVGGILIFCTIGNIPILGILIIIATIVFAWFYNSFIALASMKAAIHNELGEAFRIKKVINTLKRNFGGVFCSYFLPSLICTVICAVIVIILFSIFFFAATSSIAGIVSSFTSTNYSSNPFAIFNNIGSAISTISTIATIGTTLFAIGSILIACVICFMGALEKLLRYRALGHWISRFAPEWLNEHEEHAMVKKE